MIKKKCISLDCENQKVNSTLDEFATKHVDSYLRENALNKELISLNQALEYSISKARIDSKNDLSQFEKQLNDKPSEMNTIKDYLYLCNIKNY